MMSLLLQLFWTFFLIGAFNFGGGGAALPLIQAQVVTGHQWINGSEFADIVAISQMTPGPMGINCATYVGYEVAGIPGSMVATFALVLPSFLLFLAIVKALDRFSTSPTYLGIMKGLRPAAAGMIGAAALVLSFNFGWDGIVPRISLIKDSFPDWKAGVLFLAAFTLAYRTKLSPIWIIVGAGVLGLLIY